MGKRRDGREAAMQLLFAHDVHGKVSDDEREVFWTLHTANPGVRHHAEEMVTNILGHLAEIDDAISANVQNFRLERLTPVDRNIMRLAVYEMTYTDVPVPVVLDEAIEISKKYGTAESGGFVNGVLDRIARSLPASRTARMPKNGSRGETPPAAEGAPPTGGLGSTSLEHPVPQS